MSSDNSPLLSVVTVCFNPGPGVLDAIRSVQEQEYPAIEHIVIDGSSTDGSLEMIRCALRPSDTLVSEPDEGIYDAMNKGIALARGSAVALLNADDRYANRGVAKRSMDELAASGCDCVLGDVAFFAGDPDHIVRRYNSGRFSPARIRWGMMPAHPAMIVSKNAYERVGPYRTDYKIAADFEWVVRAFGESRLSYTYLPEIFVLMAMGGVSTQGAAARRVINGESVRACRDNGIYTNRAMVSAKYIFKALELLG